MAKKDPRQRNLIILLIIVVSFGLFDFVMNMDDYMSFYTEESKTKKTAKKVNKKPIVDKSEQRSTIPSTQKWGNDPFYDASFRVTKRRKIKKTETVKLILKAISFAENMSVAMINSQILAVGDEISGYNVKKIEPKQVLLEKNGQTKILKLQ